VSTSSSSLRTTESLDGTELVKISVPSATGASVVLSFNDVVT
jgi:hypothetical protein